MQSVPPRPSLITHSADFLREALASGEWGEVLPSERRLCARLRISRPTLRAVLAQLEREGRISAVKNKQRRILAGKAAASSRGGNTTVAMLTPLPAQWMPPFVLFWMDTLRELLADSGYQLEVQVVPKAFETQSARVLKKLVASLKPAVWVLFRSTEVMQRWFAAQEAAVVIAGSCAEGVNLPSVDVDYRAACRHAASLLLRRGFERFTLLLPDSSHGGDAESELGFQEGAAGHPGVTVLRHRESPEHLMARLDDCLRQRRPPRALLVARSAHVLTVLTHLLRQGKRVPADVAVISRDDDEFLKHVVPKVSRYAADPAKFARHLARLVLETARHGLVKPKTVRLIPAYVAGETV
jgi:LacI family transcriptional regulator